MIGLRHESLAAFRASFGGEVLAPGEDGYDRHRELWNAMIDRRPALIARCGSTGDVVSALRFGREAGLDIGVKCGGHGVLGFAIPDDGLVIDLGPLSDVRVDPARRRAWVGGGSLLRNLDRAAEPHGLATTAGNVSHTGVGGLTLGGGMGWLARQLGLACDNVAAYTVVTADGEVVRATDDEHPDLFWGLRGGGGNFGIVTEFEFRLHPTTGRALVVEDWFDDDRGARAMRAWRDLLADAPRPATLTADEIVAADPPFLPRELHGRPAIVLGFVWVGDMDAARDYLSRFRSIGTPAAETATEMAYVELQSIADERHHHGLRRYSGDHYLTELSDAAVDAFLSRGLPDGGVVDWTTVPGAGFQAYGGAIADVADEESAFSHREAILEFVAGARWEDPAEDAERLAAVRAWSHAMEPFASGAYVNAIGDEGEAAIRRAYSDRKLERLIALKDRYDPDNVFHQNQNIRPSTSLARE